MRSVRGTLDIVLTCDSRYADVYEASMPLTRIVTRLKDLFVL